MSPPRILASGDGLARGVVHELRALPQAAPHAVLLARVVALVDEVALVRVGAVPVYQGLRGAVPGLGLERHALAQAEPHGFAQRLEEGHLEGRVPGEAGPAMLAGDVRLDGRAIRPRVVVLGHGSAMATSRWKRRVVVVDPGGQGGT